VRTIFNVLGPLANPAGARRQLVGVYAEPLVRTLAEALSLLGAERAFVAYGDGLDELSTAGETTLAELRDGRVAVRRVAPEDVNLARPADPRAFAGGDAAENARLLEAVLAGEPGSRTDLVLLNAAAALVLGDRAATLRDGVEAARALVASGAARRKLEDLRQATRGG
jgi:anthranilate phosphoribosyltransferase